MNGNWVITILASALLSAGGYFYHQSATRLDIMATHLNRVEVQLAQLVGEHRMLMGYLMNPRGGLEQPGPRAKDHKH